MERDHHDHLLSLFFSKSINKRERERRRENKRRTVKVIGNIGKNAARVVTWSWSCSAPVLVKPCAHGMGGRQ
jgi:hypothetical protein